MSGKKTRNPPQFKSLNTGLARVACLPVELLIGLGALDGEKLDLFLKSLFKSKSVAEGIFLASPGLYKRLVHWTGGGQNYDDINLAFVRYLKRMADRATPFGTFASVGAFKFGDEGIGLRLPPLEDMRLDLRLNTSAVMQVVEKEIVVGLMSERLKYHLNDTMYVCNDCYCYIAYVENENNGRVYKLVEVERSSELDAVAEIARTGVLISDLCEKLPHLLTTEASYGEIAEYVASLIDGQILVTDRLISLVEGDVLDSLIDQLNEQGVGSNRIQNISADLKQLSAAGPGLDIAEYEAYSERHFGVDSSGGGRQLFQADLHIGEGSIWTVPEAVRAKIERVLSSIAMISDPVPWQLNEFAVSFSDRYGDGEVPLMELLDETRGLGFGRVDERNNPLVRAVFGGPRKVDRSGANAKSLLHGVLFEEGDISARRYIESTSEEFLNMFPGRHIKHDVHQFMLAWCALWTKTDSGEQNFVPEVRSITLQDPCRILGRFSTGNTHARDLMKEIRDREYASNLLPVEIIHLPENKSGNLTARYADANVVVTIRTGAPADVQQIFLSDIMVSVIGRRVVLRSISLNKQLDLRMSNAHNTSKSGNLTVYRFLNAVSCQNSGRLTFSPRKLFQEKRYVPGLILDGVIASRPTWRIFRSDIDKLRKLDDSERLASIREWQREMKLPEWCCLVEGETELPFNLNRDWMVRNLADELISREGGMLTEVYPCDLLPAVLSDGGAHKHELLIALENTLYAKDRLPVTKTNFAGYSRLGTKAGWLYFKIYCAPKLQDDVLRAITVQLEGETSLAQLVGMFFIRYNDPHGPHLRVRFHGPSEALTRVLFPAVTDVLEECLRKRDIFDFSLNTYDREILRYGGEDGCTLCERIFMADSKAYIDVLRHSSRPNSWQFAVRAADLLLPALGIISASQKLIFARKASNDFALEMGFTSKNRKSIGTVYKSNPLLVDDGLLARSDAAYEALTACTETTRILWHQFMIDVGCKLSEKEIYDVRWSLLHMRFNRFLKSQQRKHEAVIWDLLRRTYESQLARALQSRPKSSQTLEEFLTVG